MIIDSYRSDYVPPRPNAPKERTRPTPEKGGGSSDRKAVTFYCKEKDGTPQLLILTSSNADDTKTFEMKDPEFDAEAKEPGSSSEACKFSGTVHTDGERGHWRFVGINECVDGGMPVSLEITYAAKLTSDKRLE